MLEIAACGTLIVGALSTAYAAGAWRAKATGRTLPAAAPAAFGLDGVTVELSCRVCGWQLDRPGWIAGIATSAICDCCGAESGVDDVTLDLVREHRRLWIEHGAPWFDPECRPAHWDLYDQLSGLVRV